MRKIDSFFSTPSKKDAKEEKNKKFSLSEFFSTPKRKNTQEEGETQQIASSPVLPVIKKRKTIQERSSQNLASQSQPKIEFSSPQSQEKSVNIPPTVETVIDLVEEKFELEEERKEQKENARSMLGEIQAHLTSSSKKAKQKKLDYAAKEQSGKKGEDSKEEEIKKLHKKLYDKKGTRQERSEKNQKKTKKVEEGKSTFYLPENVRDAKGKRPGQEGYDPQTLYVPYEKYKFTDFEMQFWNMKKDNFDKVIFFRKGMFYEMFAMDADVGVKELGLVASKRNDLKLVGFPLKCADEHAQVLINKGYKV